MKDIDEIQREGLHRSVLSRRKAASYLKFHANLSFPFLWALPIALSEAGTIRGGGGVKTVYVDIETNVSLG